MSYKYLSSVLSFYSNFLRVSVLFQDENVEKNVLDGNENEKGGHHCDLSSEDEAIANDLDMHSLILSGLNMDNEPVKTAEEVIREIDDIMEVSTTRVSIKMSFILAYYNVTIESNLNWPYCVEDDICICM